MITKRIKEHKGGADDAGDSHDPATPKTNGGKKRKADTPAASAKGSAKKPKKAKGEGAEGKSFMKDCVMTLSTGLILLQM